MFLQFACDDRLKHFEQNCKNYKKISTCEESTGCSLSTGLWPPPPERKIIAINLFHSLPFEEFGFRLVLALTLTDKHGKQSVSGFEVLSVDLLHSDVL